jgi:predicted secreted protein
MKLQKLLAGALFLLLAGILPLRAGDVARIEILGFTNDGNVFAFEEYGRQDGSGFPYSHRFYINTANDSFLPNTPVRVTIEDDRATVGEARSRAKTRGEKVLKDTALGYGFQAGFNAVTEASADPFRMTVNPRPIIPPFDDPLEFWLEEMAFAPPQRCEGLGEINGFKLFKLRPVPGARVELRHQDKNIPLSRGCPLGYRLSGVQTFHPSSGKPAYAVLIAIRRYGFEGPDFRWIAATGRF